jgi:Tol biopolymer transport system component
MFSIIVGLMVILLAYLQSPPQRLSDMMTAYNPTWSADGAYLMAPCGASIDTTGEVEYELCFAKPDLSGLIRNTSAPAYGSYVPVWAPLGQTFAFGDGDGLVLSSPTQMSPKHIPLPSGCNGPVWSPDGQQIACESNDNHIVVVQLATGHSIQLPATGASFSPHWAQSGQAMLFTRTANSNPPLYDLYLVDLAAPTHARRMLTDLRPYQEVSVSADGWQLVYPNAEQTSLIMLNLHTGVSDDLLAQHQTCLSFVQDPQWSSDGRYLAFTAEQFAPASQQLYLFDMHTREVFQITQFTARDEGIVGGVAWSPDNTRLASAFDAYQREDSAQILVISLAKTPSVPINCTRILPPLPCQRSPTSACSRPAGSGRFWQPDAAKGSPDLSVTFLPAGG